MTQSDENVQSPLTKCFNLFLIIIVFINQFYQQHDKTLLTDNDDDNLKSRIFSDTPSPLDKSNASAYVYFRSLWCQLPAGLSWFEAVEGLTSSNVLAKDAQKKI